jgi:hypothetical protein
LRIGYGVYQAKGCYVMLIKAGRGAMVDAALL